MVDVQTLTLSIPRAIREHWRACKHAKNVNYKPQAKSYKEQLALYMKRFRLHANISMHALACMQKTLTTNHKLKVTKSSWLYI